METHFNSGIALASWKGLNWFAHLGNTDTTVLWWFDKMENVVVSVVLLSLAANLIIDVSPPIVRDSVVKEIEVP